jgi:hypothetical protein
MEKAIYRYAFSPDLTPRDIEETLAIAIIAVENLHGTSQTRQDATYRFDHDARICIIDAGTDVGRDLARSFTGFLTREYGERAFRVQRVTEPTTVENEEVPA